MITYTRFLSLLSDVPDCASLDEYIAECGGSVPADSAEEAIRLLTAIWTMSRDGLSIKSVAAACEVSVRRIAITLDIPARTVEDWSSGVRNPSPWQLPLIAYAVLSDYMGE
jgi:DNA-binding transcriptional regulator YiaG